MCGRQYRDMIFWSWKWKGGRCKKKFPYGKQKRQACHDKQEINYSLHVKPLMDTTGNTCNQQRK